MKNAHTSAPENVKSIGAPALAVKTTSRKISRSRRTSTSSITRYGLIATNAKDAYLRKLNRIDDASLPDRPTVPLPVYVPQVKQSRWSKAAIYGFISQIRP